MSLPQFDRQGLSLEDVGSIVPALFDDQNRYQLFAREGLAGVGGVPRATGRVLRQRQRTARHRTGRVTGGVLITAVPRLTITHKISGEMGILA
jgi:hypothetical protein